MPSDGPADPRPHSRLTPRVRRDALADAAALRLVTVRAPRPSEGTLDRVDQEVTEALGLYEARGWIDQPETYHRVPPTPEEVRTRRRRSGNLSFTEISWADGYAPWPEEPGADRFDHPKNRIARANLLVHAEGDRPWLVCLHGFGMGGAGLDLRAFRAQHLHRELGLNLAFLTLPFHGRRNPGRIGSSPPMPSPDLLDTVHGLAQAVWDARQLLAHLRDRTGQPIGLMGLSLGGLVSALVASIDEPHAALLLVPAVDLPTLMADAARRAGGLRNGELPTRAAPLFAPVNPLCLAPRVPVERRFIVAGTIDRFARPSTQAVALWRHWGEPGLHWYHGGHVSAFWARGVQAEIDAKLGEVGLSAT